MRAIETRQHILIQSFVSLFGRNSPWQTKSDIEVFRLKTVCRDAQLFSGFINPVDTGWQGNRHQYGFVLGQFST